MSTDTQKDLNRSEQDYHDKFDRGDDEFSRLTGTPDMKALDDQGDAIARDADSSRKAAQKGEKKAVGDTAAGKAAVAAANTVNPVIGGAVKLLAKIKTRGGAGTAAVIVIIVALIVGGSMLSTSLAPIAFMTNVMDDLNDQLASLDIRSEKILRTKIKATQDDVINGCTKMSIRCKLRSVSTADVQRLKDVGIEVKGKTIANRVFPDKNGYTLDVEGKSRSVTAVELADLFKTNPEVGLKFRTALNMKYFGFADAAFKWFMDRVGFSKSKATVSGDTDEEKIKSFANGDSAARPPADANFVKVGEDANGNPKYQVEGQVGPDFKTYTQTEVDLFKTQTTSLSTVKTMPKPLAQLASVVNIVGYADMACTVRNMIGAAAVGAKYAKAIALAKYAGPVGASVYAIKAGDGTEQDGKVVGAFFGDADNRKTILDVYKTVSTAATSQNNSANAAALASADGVAAANPYYGKTATDSPLYKLSSNANAGFAPSAASTSYSLSFTNTAAVVLSGIAALSSVLLGLNDTNCGLIQNWFVRGVGFVVGVVAMFFSGGTTVVTTLLMSAGLMAAMYGINTILQRMTSGQVIPDDINQKPEEKAAALWTGLAYTSGSTAQLRGMIPGNKKALTAYAAKSKQVATLYKQIDSQSVGAFDTSSSDSFIGKLALAISSNTPKDLTAPSLVAAATGMVSSSVTQSLSSSPAYAQAVSDKRLSTCDDPEYSKLSIAADVQCNLRFYLPDADLARDPDTVAKWMEDNGYVEKDTESGMPDGYSVPTAAESRGIVEDFVTGLANTFYSSRSYPAMNNAKNAHGADYGKFLDYCVYRSMPYGKTYEESGAFGDAEEGWKNGENCLKTDEMTSNFRVYTFDNSTTEVTNPVANQKSEASTGTSTSTGVISAEAKTLAQQILDLAKAGKITITDFSENPTSDRRTRSLASQQLEDIAAGKPVGITDRCSFTVPSPIIPDPKILQFLVDYGNQYHYKINTLFGQCHSSAGSNHYKGKAVDFGCPADVALADQIGSKYDVSRNFENCASNSHWHYSVGGN